MIVYFCPRWGQGDFHGDGDAVIELETTEEEEFPQRVYHVSRKASDIPDLGRSLGFHLAYVHEIER